MDTEALVVDTCDDDHTSIRRILARKEFRNWVKVVAAIMAETGQLVIGFGFGTTDHDHILERVLQVLNHHKQIKGFSASWKGGGEADLRDGRIRIQGSSDTLGGALNEVAEVAAIHALAEILQED